VDYDDNWNGVRVEGCTDCVIRNNSIRNFRTSTNSANGTAITLYGSPNALVERNFATNVTHGVYLKDSAVSLLQRGVRVRLNRIDGVNGCFRFSMTAEDRNYIFQNVCSNSGFGLFITGGGLSNDWIFNNTFYNLSASALYPSGLGVGGRFWNNVVVNADTVVLSEAAPMPSAAVLSLEHNVYFGHRQFYTGTDGNRTFASFKSTFPQDSAAPASVEGNPLLVNPGGGDFRVNPGSAAEGRAVDIFDLDGDGSTTDTIRAGAHVTNTEIIGVANGGGGGGSADTPSAPSNLRILSQ
jgi:hypothetical protein